jgi:membrane fusion protein, multidrug efflux system
LQHPVAGIRGFSMRSARTVGLSFPLFLRGADAVLALLPIVALMTLGACNRQDSSQVHAAVPTSRPATQAVAESGPAAPEGKWTQVRRETLRQYTPAVGSFFARETTHVAPQVSGRVEAILVDVGDTVAKGQVLVRLDPTFFEIEVRQAEASLEAGRAAMVRAEVGRADTEREMRRQLDVFEKGAGTFHERDATIAVYERAAAELKERQARLTEAERMAEYARQRLKETQILAPYDAVVTRKMVSPGESVTAAPVTSLLEVQAIDALHLEFSLPQEMLGKVLPGREVEFDVEGVEGRHGTGRIAVIFPAIDEATRSFRCRVVVKNEGLKLHPGLLAEIRVVEQEAPDAMAIPRRALTRAAAGWQAFVSNDGHPVSRTIEVGILTDDLAEVRSGLGDRDSVLVPNQGR